MTVFAMHHAVVQTAGLSGSARVRQGGVGVQPSMATAATGHVVPVRASFGARLRDGRNGSRSLSIACWSVPRTASLRGAVPPSDVGRRRNSILDAARSMGMGAASSSFFGAFVGDTEGSGSRRGAVATSARAQSDVEAEASQPKARVPSGDSDWKEVKRGLRRGFWADAPAPSRDEGNTPRSAPSFAAASMSMPTSPLERRKATPEMRDYLGDKVLPVKGEAPSGGAAPRTDDDRYRVMSESDAVLQERFPENLKALQVAKKLKKKQDAVSRDMKREQKDLITLYSDLRPFMEEFNIEATDVKALKDLAAFIDSETWQTGDRDLRLAILRWKLSKFQKKIHEQTPAFRTWLRNMPLRRGLKRLRLGDHFQKQSFVPKVLHDPEISYSMLLELLERRMVRRLVMYGDSSMALVEVPWVDYYWLKSGTEGWRGWPNPEAMKAGASVWDPNAKMLWETPYMPPNAAEGRVIYMDGELPMSGGKTAKWMPEVEGEWNSWDNKSPYRLVDDPSDKYHGLPRLWRGLGVLDKTPEDWSGLTATQAKEWTDLLFPTDKEMRREKARRMRKLRPILDKDVKQIYYEQPPEGALEKLRFWCYMPGDLYMNDTFMGYVHRNMAHEYFDEETGQTLKTSQNLPLGEYVLDLQVLDHHRAVKWYPSVNKMVMAGVPLGLLFAVRLGFSALGKLEGKKKKRSEREEKQMLKQIGKMKSIMLTGKQKSDVTFDDVAGNHTSVRVLRESLEALLGSRLYADAGAKPPRGVLLEGPPGTGKTHMARALAGEAGIPFFAVNGAEFVEMYMGVASMRVRDLFKQARRMAPSIVFIDEVDAIGRARKTGGGFDPGTLEREQGLMQLLVEMDGVQAAGAAQFSDDDQDDDLLRVRDEFGRDLGSLVMVIGATNRRDVLDAALLRPGRFDKVLRVDLPTEENRYGILKIHARNKPINPAGDREYADNAILRRAAKSTNGFSGASLANLLNEAAIQMVRSDKTEIDWECIAACLENLGLGYPRDPFPPGRLKKRYAYILAGRALFALLRPGTGELDYVSMKPRGQYLVRCNYRPKSKENPIDEKMRRHRWYGLGTLDEYKDILMCCYAALSTEQCFFGSEGTTYLSAEETYAAGELAHWLAGRSTVCPETGAFQAFTNDTNSHKLTKALEDVQLKLVHEAKKRADAFCLSYKDALEAIAEAIYEAEELRWFEIQDILDQHPPDMVSAAFESLGPQRSWKQNVQGAGQSRFSSGGAGRAGDMTFFDRSSPAGVPAGPPTTLVRRPAAEEEVWGDPRWAFNAAGKQARATFKRGAGRVGAAAFNGPRKPGLLEGDLLDLTNPARDPSRARPRDDQYSAVSDAVRIEGRDVVYDEFWHDLDNWRTRTFGLRTGQATLDGGAAAKRLEKQKAGKPPVEEGAYKGSLLVNWMDRFEGESGAGVDLIRYNMDGSLKSDEQQEAEGIAPPHEGRLLPAALEPFEDRSEKIRYSQALERLEGIPPSTEGAMSGRIPDWQLEDMGFDVEEANRRYERAETIQVNRFLRQTKDVTLTDAFRGSPFKGVAVSVSMLFFDATAGNVYKIARRVASRYGKEWPEYESMFWKARVAVSMTLEDAMNITSDGGITRSSLEHEALSGGDFKSMASGRANTNMDLGEARVNMDYLDSTNKRFKR